MSRRTSAADKAIRDAWKNEQNLVREGKCTRDWTPDQQRDILEKGKAYDENGKAFEGHHMKSAEAYPEYQGDPENIQFLTRDEHKDAHQGNFQNPTNGYYDPETGETKDFGEGRYEPCEINDLSEPVATQDENITRSESEELDNHLPDNGEELGDLTEGEDMTETDDLAVDEDKEKTDDLIDYESEVGSETEDLEENEEEAADLTADEDIFQNKSDSETIEGEEEASDLIEEEGRDSSSEEQADDLTADKGKDEPVGEETSTEEESDGESYSYL